MKPSPAVLSRVVSFTFRLSIISGAVIRHGPVIDPALAVDGWKIEVAGRP